MAANPWEMDWGVESRPQPSDLMPWERDWSSPAANQARARAVVPDATFGSVARDIASGVAQIPGVVVKGFADVARLATGDEIGKDTSEAAESYMDWTRRNIGSERAAAQRQNFQADMADDNVGVWDALSNNKGAIADQILPTLGSMVLPMGAAGLAGRAATIGRAAQGLDKAALAARVASAQTAAGVGATAAQNSADTFVELLDKGYSLQDAYTGAAVAAPFSVVAGTLMKGGAEGALVRAMSGQGTGRGLLGFGAALGRESGQEMIETAGQIAGEAVATDTMPSMNSVGKQLGVAGTLGAIVGGGGNLASQVLSAPPSAADEIARAFDADVANTRFAASADDIARQSLDPRNYAPPPPIDPVKSIVEGEVSPADRSMLDLLVPNRPTAPAAAPSAPTVPDVGRPPISDVDPTGDFGASNAELTALEAARGIGQAPVPQPIPEVGAPVPAAAQEPAQPAPNYEITESGTLLVNRPISEVRPLAPGAWMIRAPGGGTLVGRTAAPAVQAALDAEAPVDTVNVSPGRVENQAGNEQVASSLETVASEPAPALRGAEVSRFETAQPPVAPGATAKAAAALPSYTTNRDGTLVVNMTQPEAAAFLPDVKTIQTRRGLLVGRTQAAEAAAVLDVIQPLPEAFKTEQEARTFAKSAGLPDATPVVAAGGGFVIRPPVQEQTQEQITTAAAAVAKLNDGIQASQIAAQRIANKAPVQLVTDAELSQQGVGGQSASLIMRAVRAAFQVPVVAVRNLTANGAYNDGHAFLDVGQIATDGGGGVRGFMSRVIFTVGHEVGHYFQNSKSADDQAVNAKLKKAVDGYLRAGVVEQRQADEQSKRSMKLGERYGEFEVDSDLSGGFWLDSKFWGRLVQLDNGSTARKVFYRFMQAATRFAVIAKGSNLDVTTFIEKKAEVREAYAQAWAARAARQGVKTGAGATQGAGGVSMPQTAADAASAGSEVAFSQSERLSEMSYEKQPVQHVQAARNLAALLKELDEGKVSPGMFETRVRLLSSRMTEVSETKSANRILSERVRGADVLRERLIAARRRGELENDTVEFGLWAIDLNPAIAEDLGISIKSAPDGKKGVAGEYNRFAKVIRLFKGSQNMGTAVHEILHHTERMMPADVQAGIAGAWSKAVAKAAKDATPEQRKAIQALIEGSLGDKKAEKEAMQAFDDGVLDYDKHYQLTNPSEFWAVNATRILSSRFEADSWAAKAKQWLTEMLQKVKGLLRLPSDAPVLRGLRAVLEGDGSTQSKQMLTERAMTMRDIQERDDVTPAGSARAADRPSQGVEFAHGQSRLVQGLSEAGFDGQGAGRLVRQESTEPSLYTTGRARPLPYSESASPREIDAEEARLIARAKAEGFFWGVDKMPDIVALLGKKRAGGNEHDVFIVGSAPNKVVIRKTVKDSYGFAFRSPSQYLKRIDDYNRTFPNLQVRVIGVSRSPVLGRLSDNHGNGVVWTAQTFVEGEEFANESDLQKAMEAHGWEHVKDLEYRHKETGAVIDDAHTGNVLHRGDELLPIDVIIKRTPAEVQFSQSASARPSQTETPEFKRWFKDSKVVDANGRPLVVYHGTTGDVRSFDKKRRGQSTQADSARRGFFFVEDIKSAESYAHYAATDARIAALVKEAEKAEARGDWDAYDAKVQEYEDLDASFSDPMNRLAGQNVMPVYVSLQNPLRVDAKGENAQGFDISGAIKQAVRSRRDGVIIDNLDDAAGLVDRPSMHVIAFEPTQIKSAIGNRGTFDPANADISLSQSTRPIDHATRYAGVMVEQKILIEDTGQTGTLRLDAGQAIADLDQRAYRMRRLLECLG